MIPTFVFGSALVISAPLSELSSHASSSSVLTATQLERRLDPTSPLILEVRT